MNPMIPLDAVNSSIPCALFRMTAKNLPGRPVANVDLFATLQNAVGSGGDGGVQGVRFGGYGQNRNRVVREEPAPAAAAPAAAAWSPWRWKNRPTPWPPGQ